jgi:nucleoside-diphosphate kinase
VRTVALLRPDLLIQGKSEELLAKFEENYLEVKAKKQVYLTKEDAETFFHYQPPQHRAASVEGWTKGLSEVVLLEHLDGDVIDRAIGYVKELASEYGEDNIYCSQSLWESRRDMEFFFPHLDAAPVERTLALIKPEGIMKGEVEGQTLERHVEAAVAAAGLYVVGKKMIALGDAEAGVLCKEYEGTSDHKGHVNSYKGDPGCVAMCVEGPGAIAKWQLICGPTNAGVCKDRAPTTLRAAWGTDSTCNAVHASSCMEAAEKELKLLFPEGSLQLQRTLCIVKPHAMTNVLQIRMEIEDAGFTVLKEKHTVLSEERAKEFYRDFKGEPSFNAMVQEATSGKCALLVLCRLEAVTVLQQLMGPAVVKDAKAFRPRTVRARYGRDGQKNAVHGSETAKSAAWEVRFFFPELGADPIPGDDEVRDFLFRKSAGASMDLKTLSSADSTDYTLDPTLQQLISSGLLSLCQVRPKGLQAITWFRDWLVQNNPNAAATGTMATTFNPPDRTKHFVEHGINQDGLPFSVEAPAPEKKKKILDVDVSEEVEETRVAEFVMPPMWSLSWAAPLAVPPGRIARNSPKNSTSSTSTLWR